MVPRSKSSVQRRYIRHPSGMPLEFCLHGEVAPRTEHLCNVSRAGLCFRSAIPLTRGDGVHIHIPVSEQHFEADARVMWCHRSGNGYEVGVQFVNPDVRFAVRMVEQLCYIEAYRREVLHEQGRELSSEAAAREWVEQFAAGFPRMV